MINDNENEAENEAEKEITQYGVNRRAPRHAQKYNKNKISLSVMMLMCTVIPK